MYGIYSETSSFKEVSVEVNPLFRLGGEIVENEFAIRVLALFIIFFIRSPINNEYYC